MKTKALALISGGLDSLLAAKVIMNQGIDVEGINFFTGFTGDIPSELLDEIPSRLHTKSAKISSENIGMKLHVVNIFEDYKKILMDPTHGYGANMNPCLDCKMIMVNHAISFMKKNGFDFLISGEVLGQRPKSQMRNSMSIVSKNTDGLLLRPLSAKLLPATKIEQNGWVDRDKLLSISGRSRLEQMKLAESLNIKNYPQPAGGCILTDMAFCKRLRYILNSNKKKFFCEKNDTLTKCNKNNDCDYNDYLISDLYLARLGRYIVCLEHDADMIIGRNDEDNVCLEMYQKFYPSMHVKNYPGALAIIKTNNDIQNNEIFLKKAAAIVAWCSKGRGQDSVDVELQLVRGNVVSLKGIHPNEKDILSGLFLKL